MFAKPVLSVDQLKSVWEYCVLDYPSIHVSDILRFFEKEKVGLQIGVYPDPKVVAPFITVSMNTEPDTWTSTNGNELIDVLYEVLMKYLEANYVNLEAIYTKEEPEDE